MKNILITENQLRLITEKLGVPDSILDAAEEIYQLSLEHVKSIDSKQDEYVFEDDVDIELGGKKKITIDELELSVKTEYFSEFRGKPEVISMGMGQIFTFDTDELMKKIQPSTKAEMEITFAVGDDWEPEDLYQALLNNKESHLSSVAHELKHKYDKQVKKFDLIGRDAEYVMTQRYGNFGIPVIDHQFMRYLYYAHLTENLVRSVEVASEMREKNITKSQFYEYITKNRVYKELQEIKNFTFEKFINLIYQQMDRVDKLLEHLGEDYENMSDSEKIRRVLEVVYLRCNRSAVPALQSQVFWLCVCSVSSHE